MCVCSVPSDSQCALCKSLEKFVFAGVFYVLVGQEEISIQQVQSMLLSKSELLSKKKKVAFSRVAVNRMVVSQQGSTSSHRLSAVTSKPVCKH